MTRIELIEAARGDRPLDTVIKNVNLINVFTCEIYPADIGIYGDRVALVGPANVFDLQAKKVIDGTGKWASPGFVDSHLHIESTMVTPANYAAAVLPFGTTTSIIDPHEIANVMGMEGVRYMVEASEGLPLRVYISIPTCVPSVPGKETSGADFGADKIAEMLTWPRVIAEAEVMDYMGVVKGSPRMTAIVQAGLDANVTIQGHSPLLMGRDLNAYAAAGIDNDHELRRGNEGLEKLRLGILPLLKLGSFGNHIKNILPTIKEVPFLEIALCTDDVHPGDIIEHGHMNRVIKEVISHGIDPARAFRYATLVGARNYALKDHGAIAPGYLADIVLLTDLEDVVVSDVFVNGKQVSKNGKLIISIPEPKVSIKSTNSVQLHTPLTLDMFTLKAPIKEGEVDVNTIVYEPSRLTHLDVLTIPVVDYQLQLDALDTDMCFITVVPRHGQKHSPQTVVLKGLEWRRGTMAMTIAHDSHNLIVAGHDPSDMLLAARELEKCGGGVAFVDKGKVLGKVELPLAGLMSSKPVSDLAVEIAALDEIARRLGVEAPSPALAIVGLALVVAPRIRVSDLVGLFDTLEQIAVPIFSKFKE
jgi:adenine deaminase